MHLRQIISLEEEVLPQAVSPLKYRKSLRNRLMSHIAMKTIQARSPCQVTQRMSRENRSVPLSYKEILAKSFKATTRRGSELAKNLTSV